MSVTNDSECVGKCGVTDTEEHYCDEHKCTDPEAEESGRGDAEESTDSTSTASNDGDKE